MFAENVQFMLMRADVVEWTCGLLALFHPCFISATRA